MLLQFLAALPARHREQALVWLPTDVPHGAFPLCGALAERGIRYEHVELPVLRRQYLGARGMAATARRLVAVRRRLAAVDPQTLVLATSAVLPVGLALGARADRSVVLHLQEVWEGSQARVLGAMARRVDRVVAISGAASDSLPPGLQRRTTVVPNATTDPGDWSPLDDRQGPLVFLVASRWMPWKGHEVLFRAWDEAGSPGRLVVLGGPPPLGAAADVRALAAGAVRPETIEIVGEVEDPDPHLRAADVMVVPSVRDEPFGLVTIEAFARGRPVIGSANGGLRETIAEGAGWLFPPGDHRALADRLRSLTRAEAAEAGRRARARYERCYSPPAFAAGLRDALGLTEG
jgi:glycosyltransferase involved in cell wall biosynthesis